MAKSSPPDTRGIVSAKTQEESADIEISIVVPVFNERDNLPQLHKEIALIVNGMGRSTEIIYVDDCSVDDSHEVLAEIITAASKQSARIRLVRFRYNYGQTAAMAAGFQLARGDVVIPIDADLQNNPADIPRLVSKLEEGYDVVSGWRRSRKDHFITRRLPSMVANWLIGVMTGVHLHDYGCTLKAYRRSVLTKVKLHGEMHRFIPVYLAKHGARVTEIEVDHRPRIAGKSKYGLLRIFKVALDLVLLRFLSRYATRPMYFFGQAAFLFTFLTFTVFGLMLVFKFGWLRLVGIDYQASFVSTPLPALAASFFLGAVFSVFFGILGEMLMRVYHESQEQDPFTIRSITDSEDEH